MKLRKSAERAALSIAVSCGIYSIAEAQGPLEEVIVTARRVTESVQDVPISISAITGDDLNRLNIQSTNQVQNFVPNLTMETNGRTNNTNIFIRGVGGGDPNAAGAQAGVGIYVDGIYMPRIEGGFMSTLDIERIEVLRGPQGTLFGKNTTGGAINVVSVKPQPETSGSFTIRGGNFNRKEARAMVNVPITDKLYARFSGVAESRDGYYTETVTGADYSNREEYAGRVALRYLPNDDWTVDVSASYANQPQRPPGANCIFLNRAGFTNANETATGIVFSDVCTGRPEDIANGNIDLERSFASDIQGLSGTQIYSVNTEVAYTPESNGFFDTQEFKLIVGARGQRQTLKQDTDFTIARIDSRTREEIRQDQRQFELQFNAGNDRLSLTSGLFWADDLMKEGENDCQDELATIDLSDPTQSVECVNPGVFAFHIAPAAFAQGIGPSADLGTQIYGLIETTALYANLTYDVTDAFSVTVGARQTWEDREFSRLQVDNIFFGVDTTVATLNQANVSLNTRGAGDWSEFTPTLSLGYNVAGGALDSGNFYFTYANGFLSGGFNTELPQEVLGDAFLYEPETVDSYEVGFKSTWFDGRMRLNIAYFDADYKDRQVEVPVDPNAFPNLDPNLAIFGNAATQNATGVELDLTLAPVDNLLVNLNFGTLDTEFTEFMVFDPAQQMLVDASNRRPDQRNPNDSGSIYIEYAFDLSSGGRLTPSLSGSYRGDLERDSDTLIGDPRSIIFQDAYTKWDAGLTWTNSAESMTVRGFIENLTDEDYPVGGTVINRGPRGFAAYYLGPPRMWGLELRRNF